MSQPAALADYRDVRMLLGEGNPQLCTAIQTDLGRRGLKHVTACSGSNTLVAALGREPYEVLVCDVDLPGGDFVKTMQRIRRRALGRNPFMAVIATISDTASETIKKAVESGADDVIRKPMSMDLLFQRMAKLIEAKKPFAVSYGYVGPTRRAEQRPGEEIVSLLDPPNTLKGRAVDGLNDSQLQSMVDTAATYLGERQLDALGDEVLRVVRRVLAGYEGEGTDAERRGDLNRLIMVTDELKQVTTDAGKQSISDLAALLVAMAQRVLRSRLAEKVKEIDLMVKLGEAIHRALSVERDAVGLMSEITDAIARLGYKH